MPNYTLLGESTIAPWPSSLRPWLVARTSLHLVHLQFGVKFSFVVQLFHTINHKSKFAMSEGASEISRLHIFNDFGCLRRIYTVKRGHNHLVHPRSASVRSHRRVAPCVKTA